jgi:hypothetical protein
MTSFDYDSIRDSVVIPQIAHFGKSATLTQPGVPTGPDYDPTPGTPTVYPITVLETGPPGSGFTIMNEGGSLVRTDDRWFMMSVDGDPAPGLNGVLTLSGVDIQVISLNPVQPGPVIMFWRVRCKK